MATPYHRLAREHPDHAWWKLPVAGVIGVFGYFAASIALVVAALLVALAFGRGAADSLLSSFESAEISTDDPGILGFNLLALAIMLPCVMLAVLATGPRPVGYLSSVAGRVRWRWLGLLMVVSFVVYGVAIAGGAAAFGETRAPSVDGTAIAVLVVVIALTPFQAAAEEYVFRGYLLQLVGSWTRFAIVPILVSTPLFALGHAYGLWGLVDVAIFGVTAAVLTLRTGGLEAAVAAHTANNVVLFVLEALGMLALSDGQDGGPLSVTPTIVTGLVVIGVVEVLFRRSGLERTRAPLPPKPKPAPPWTLAPQPAYGQPPYPQPWYPPQPSYAAYPAPHPPVRPPHGYPAYPGYPGYPGYPAHAAPPAPAWNPYAAAPPQAPRAPQHPAPDPAPPRIAPGTPPYPGEIADDWGQPDVVSASEASR